MSQMEAELKLPLVQNWQSRGSAALRQIANCPSNVRWRRVRTDGRLLDTLTEPGSLWSMSPLSSPCRMETVPGFSPWKLVIPHCGTPCLAFNFPINNFSQHLFARARNCRGWCHDAYSDMGRCYQFVATLMLRGNTHTQIIPNPSQSSKHLISHDNCKKHLAFESQWVKWKQNWNFRTFKIRKVELLHHLRTLPIVPAMSVGDVCRQLPGSRSMISMFLLFSKFEKSLHVHRMHLGVSHSTSNTRPCPFNLVHTPEEKREWILELAHLSASKGQSTRVHVSWSWSACRHRSVRCSYRSIFKWIDFPRKS